MELCREAIYGVCFPENAACLYDEKEDISMETKDECPIGHQGCNGDCEYYTEY